MICREKKKPHLRTGLSPTPNMVERKWLLLCGTFTVQKTLLQGKRFGQIEQVLVFSFKTLTCFIQSPVNVN